jgi:GWxTD domain-containing protein
MKINALIKPAIILFLMLVSLTGNSLAQESFYFVYDYGIYRGQEGKSILEIYYSFYPRHLKYTYEDGSYKASAQIDVKLYDKQNNEVKLDQTYNVPHSIGDTAGTALERIIVGQLTYQLNPGTYKLEITGKDGETAGREQKMSQDILVSDFSSQVAISDIELATALTKSSDKGSVFYKNTLEVTPAPDQMFGYNMNKLHYYFEIYGLTGSEYTLKAAVTNANKDQVFMSNEKKITAKSDGRVEIGSFALDSLPSSSYLLYVTLTDNTTKLSYTKEKKFFVRNKAMQEEFNITAGDEYLKSEYAAMKEELVNYEFEISNYIRTDKDNSTWQSLTNLDDKRKFMFNFWRQKDPNINTPKNEFKIEFVKRIIEANNLIKEPFKEGWKTDRGRVYVLFGKPDDIESHPYEADKKSYEVWKYDKVEGGATVVFVETQSSGSGIFQQVHSTIRGEVRNDNWERELTF